MSSDLTFSYVPGDVIPVGKDITIQAPRAVDPVVAKEVVNILRGSNPANLTISTTDKTITVPTTGLAPGFYDLVVGELLDTSGVRLSRLVVRPLILTGGTPGKVADNLRIEYSVTLAIGETSVTRLASGEPKPSGTTTIVHRIKAVDRTTDKFEDIAVDENGERVDIQKMFTDLDDRRFKKFGRLQESLWNHIQSRSAEDMIDVVVWPRITKDLQMGDRSLSDQEFAATEEIFLARVHSMRDSIVRTLEGLGGRCQPSFRNVPAEFRPTMVYVPANVPIGQLQTLAENDSVGAILLDDKSAVTDLRDSIVVSRTDEVHQLNVKGKGVKAAIFEQGPDDETNLVFAGRYLQNPTKSDHARLTSAVVKNKQAGAPNGHAPECDLYSANSYDNEALHWAVAQRCTVISQSFHRGSEQTNGDLQPDDILHDWLALRDPYPTIVQAAGNFGGAGIKPERDEYVNHKGYNTLTIGNHDDQAFAISGTSCYRNPISPHGDRELPELCANGTVVAAVGLAKSGTSFAAPAVAGVVALLQEANSTLKSWPQACRAILIAASNRKLAQSTWWADVGTFAKDVKVGAGALDAEASYQIAIKKVDKNNTAIPDGWAAITLVNDDFDGNKLSKFKFNMAASGSPTSQLDRYKSKVAIAWDSEVTASGNTPTSSKLTTDLDLIVKDSKNQTVAASSSYDNSYEVADFNAIPNESYQIYIRRTSGTGSVKMAVAWRIEKTSWLLDKPGYTGVNQYIMASGNSAIGTYETTNDPSTVLKGARYSALFSVGTIAPSPPQVVTGLNSVDMGNNGWYWASRIDTYGDSITDRQFKLNINTWSDTFLYNARVSWLSLSNPYSGVQCGRFDSRDRRPSGTIGNIFETIKFPYKFNKPPIVYVGLSGWDIVDNWRIALWIDPTSIKVDSFDIRIDTWGSSDLYAAVATWVAIDVDKPGILTGEFKAKTGELWSGTYTFGRPFVKVPAMFNAFTRFDMDHFKNMRCKITTTPTSRGFNWAIDKWSDSTLYQVSASWLAMEL